MIAAFRSIGWLWHRQSRHSLCDMSAGPLRGRIRLGDQLRDRFARRTPGGLIQRIKILPNGSLRPGNALPVNLIRASNSALFVAVSRDQAGIDRKSASGRTEMNQRSPRLQKPIFSTQSATSGLMHRSKWNYLPPRRWPKQDILRGSAEKH